MKSLLFTLLLNLSISSFAVADGGFASSPLGGIKLKTKTEQCFNVVAKYIEVNEYEGSRTGEKEGLTGGDLVNYLQTIDPPGVTLSDLQFLTEDLQDAGCEFQIYNLSPFDKYAFKI